MFVSKIKEILAHEEMSIRSFSRLVRVTPTTMTNILNGGIPVTISVFTKVIENYIIPKYKNSEVVEEIYKTLLYNQTDVTIGLYFLPKWTRERMQEYLKDVGRDVLANYISQNSVIKFSDLKDMEVKDVWLIIKSLQYSLGHLEYRDLLWRFEDSNRYITPESISKDYPIRSVIYDICNMEDRSMRAIVDSMGTTESKLRSLMRSDQEFQVTPFILILKYIRDMGLPYILTERLLDVLIKNGKKFRMEECDIVVNGVVVNNIDYFLGKFGRSGCFVLKDKKFNRGQHISIPYGIEPFDILIKEIVEIYKEK